jgi:hypothetical protein
MLPPRGILWSSFPVDNNFVFVKLIAKLCVQYTSFFFFFFILYVMKFSPAWAITNCSSADWRLQCVSFYMGILAGYFYAFFFKSKLLLRYIVESVGEFKRTSSFT